MGHLVLFISGGELMIVVLAILLFFGADAIPGLARTVGKGMREFKKPQMILNRNLTIIPQI